LFGGAVFFVGESIGFLHLQNNTDSDAADRLSQRKVAKLQENSTLALIFLL